MKKVILILFIGLLGVIASNESNFFDKQTAAEEASTSQEKATQAATKSSTETKTMVKIGKEDSTLYADAALTTPLTVVNGGELTTYLTPKNDAYQVTTNDGTTGYLALTNGSIVEKTVQETPTDLSDAVIVIDPGHGGSDTGALSTNEEIEEKTITLSTAKKVKKELEATGATVYLTRTSDTFVQLGDICTYSEAKKADIFISLHADSTEYANEATGITTYYYYQENEKLAQTVSDSFDDLPLASRGIATGNYQVLRENLQPALLVEMGYMNNDADLAEMTTSSYQQQLAESLTEALRDYFELQG